MITLKIPQAVEVAGLGAEEVKAIADALGREPAEVVGDVVEAVESGCLDVEAILGYLRPGVQQTAAPVTPPVPGPTPATMPMPGVPTPAPVPPPVPHVPTPAPMPGVPTPPTPVPPTPGFNLAGYISRLSGDVEASLVTAGRYKVRVSDVKVATDANDLGLRYAVFDMEIVDHPDADPVPLYAAVDLDDSLKGADGLPLPDMDPVARSRFLAGLKTLERLIAVTDVTPEEMAGAESVDDALGLFVGCELRVAITKGKDRDGLPCNKFKTIIGAVDG